MCKKNTILICFFYTLYIAFPSWASKQAAKIELSSQDANCPISIIIKTKDRTLTNEQITALHNNPFIDTTTEPLAIINFEIKDSNGNTVNQSPYILSGKASVFIPYWTVPSIRSSEIEAFLWDPEEKKWGQACSSMTSTFNDFYQIVSDTENYPTLNASLVKTDRLSTIILLRKKASEGTTSLASDSFIKSQNANLIDSIDVRENQSFVIITTANNELIISKQTGEIYNYEVLKPLRFSFTPAGLGGLKIYVVNKDINIAGFFDICKAIEYSKETFQGDEYLVVDMKLDSSSAYTGSIAEASVQYRIGNEITFVKTEVEFKKDDPSQFELGVYQRYNPTDWYQQFFPTIANTLQRPILKKCFARYSDLEEDTTRSEKAPREYTPDNSAKRNVEVFVDKKNLDDRTELVRATSMPWSIIEGDSYFMMYGYLDLNTVMIASPNRFKGIPSFSLQPKGIKKDKKYTFDYFLKFFPKPENNITDVCKWYAENRYSTNPLSKGLVKFSNARKHKTTIPRANYGGPKYSLGPTGWMNYEEQFLTKGNWIAHFDTATDEPVEMIEMSAEKLQAEYNKLKDEGKYITPYTRQIRQWYAYHEDRPPYKDWILRAKHGYPFSYFRGAVPIEEQIGIQGYLQEEVWDRLGIRTKEQASRLSVHDDFCNPEFIDWYVNQHIEYSKFYNVDGMYFDMGWGTHVSPCFRHPDSGIFHGELRAISEITNAGREMDPPKMFFIDENIHSPTIMYVDGAFTNEGGLNTDKVSIDSVKFNRVSFTNLIYPGVWEQAYGEQEGLRLMIKAAFANLSYGITHANSTGYIESKTQYQPFLDFSAWATAMALVYEKEAITFVPMDENVTGSIWADSNDVLAVFFNNSDRDKKLNAYLNTNLIRQYGYNKKLNFSFELLNTKGETKDSSTFSALESLENSINIKGDLPPETLCMIRSFDYKD